MCSFSGSAPNTGIQIPRTTRYHVQLKFGLNQMEVNQKHILLSITGKCFVACRGEEELSGTTLITINGINVNHLMLFDLNENNSPKVSKDLAFGMVFIFPPHQPYIISSLPLYDFLAIAWVAVHVNEQLYTWRLIIILKCLGCNI